MKIRHRKRTLARQRHKHLLKNRGIAGIRYRAYLQHAKYRLLARRFASRPKENLGTGGEFQEWKYSAELKIWELQ